MAEVPTALATPPGVGCGEPRRRAHEFCFCCPLEEFTCEETLRSKGTFIVRTAGLKDRWNKCFFFVFDFRLMECGERAFYSDAADTQSEYENGVGSFESGEDSKAHLKEFPWQVTITHWRKHHCGGSLINEYWVVTTAQCVANRKSKDLQVVTGTVDLTHQENTHNVEKIISHEDYNPIIFSDDIALLELTQPVNYSDLASPVCFPDTNYMDPDRLDSCWTTGWSRMHMGSPKQVRFLHKTRTDYLSKSQCEIERGDIIWKDMICTQNTSPNSKSCSVEAGSPLVCLSQISSRWILLGTLSLTPSDCQSAIVYTRVAHYIDWVKDQTVAVGKPFIPLIPAAPTDLQREGSGSGLGEGPPAKTTAKAGGKKLWRWTDRFKPESLAKENGTLNRGGVVVTPHLLQITCCALSFHSLCLLIS
ncbi:tryptase-like [Heterodontus francisci]|uniref:tryptase-like n=1 Tax=Heterodontus francisci TaxID=7792 RepID=UPI00355B0558